MAAGTSTLSPTTHKNERSCVFRSVAVHVMFGNRPPTFWPAAPQGAGRGGVGVVDALGAARLAGLVDRGERQVLIHC